MQHFISAEAFSELLDIAENLMQSFPHADNLGSSIEFSFSTIDDTKIELIAAHGIHRISTGIQVYDDGLMASSGRINTPLDDMLHKVSAIRACGIKTLNLDLMYGFERQTTLRLRMYDCIPYKGFGVSAQFMSRTGISYNILKSSAFYAEGINFLLKNCLIDIENDICRVTREGFRTYGAVASLFWSEHHKRKYIEGVSA